MDIAAMLRQIKALADWYSHCENVETELSYLFSRLQPNDWLLEKLERSIISDNEILFPQVLHPDVLVSLTTQACAKFLPLIRPNGIMLFDSDLVQPERRMDAHYVGLPMHREVVDKFHKTQALNICVLGVLLSLTKIVDVDAVRKCLADKFKPAFHEANNQALDLGLQLGESVERVW